MKEKLRLLGDHLRPNPRRHFGPERAPKVECKKHKAFYPSDESCPDCACWTETVDAAVDKFMEEDEDTDFFTWT